MSWFRITFLAVFLSMSMTMRVDASHQLLSDKDIINDVLSRLNELEHRDRHQQAEIDELRKENKEQKSLRENDRNQNAELDKLRKANEELSKEIYGLKQQNIRLGEEIKHIENRIPTTTAEPFKEFKRGNDFNEVQSNSESRSSDMVSSDGQNTDDNTGNVSEMARKPGHDRIRQSAEGSTIAFFASRSGAHMYEHLGQNQAIIFDRIITNNGGGYHNTTGIFTAPVDGLYVFSTTLLAPSESAHFQIVVNGQGYSYMIAHSADKFETMSQTAIFNLRKGDDVAVQNMDVNKLVNGYHYSTFAGFLLASMEGNAIVG